MGNIFVNCSNTHTNKWPQDRLDAALELVDGGEIVNIGCPILPPEATAKEVYEKAEALAEKIISYNPSVVFCQGELTVCFRIVEILKQNNIKVVGLCNRRVVSESGTITGFQFVQFREY